MAIIGDNNLREVFGSSRAFRTFNPLVNNRQFETARVPEAERLRRAAHARPGPASCFRSVPRAALTSARFRTHACATRMECITPKVAKTARG